jgi:DNA-binding transcriptional MerR regulator
MRSEKSFARGLTFVPDEGVEPKGGYERRTAVRERLLVGEVAEVLGIAPNAVRYYHDVGLVPEPERSEGGYRLYGAEEALRLERVRRLRSLGLSIEQVRSVLDDPEGERGRLRRALESRLEEISAEILELEGRRERISEALRGDDPEALLLRPAAFLPEGLEELAAADSETTEGLRRFWASFRAFRWPKELRDELARMGRSGEEPAEEDPETARLGDELFARFDALEGVPEDSPEVERLAEDYFGEYSVEEPLEPELQERLDRFAEAFEGNGAFARLFANLVMASFSPAQRRFVGLLHKRGGAG